MGVMRRFVVIFLCILLTAPAFCQYSWRFSPSYTFDAPAFSKEVLASRAGDYRRFAEFQLNAPDIYQYDTQHHTSWFLSNFHLKVSGRDIYTIIKYYVTILPQQGRYTVFVEKAEVFASAGRKTLLDNEILRSDDSVYRDKLTKATVTEIKSYIQEQFDGLIPRIREIMEDPLDGFRLQEITD
jgi:hypothetical protein